LENIRTVGIGQDRFQTFSGIQLYFAERIAFANGHIYYAQSPYGLSAVSQIQYWAAAGSEVRGGLLGNLSIDIGNWRRDRDVPSPNDLSPHGLAEAIWSQITTRPTDRTRRPPAYFHIDDLIQYSWVGAPGGHVLRPRWNRSPYLVNRTGEQALRPCGDPWSTLSRRLRGRLPGIGQRFGTDQGLWQHRDGGYVMHFGNLVFAGTYMRTFTRLATMESANESARHAVNAILDHATHGHGEPRDYMASSRWADVLVEDAHVHAGASRPEILYSFLSRNDAFVRPSSYPRASGSKIATRYGDYCDTWDPETHEIPDLDFLRDIDEQLVQQHLRRGLDDRPEGESSVNDRPPPHIFDLLRLDELPDHLDTDHHVRGALDLLAAGLSQLNSTTGKDLTAALTAIDKLRGKIVGLLGRVAAAAPPK
ncbi:MAG: hypothetical protein ACREBE_01050, partial [bacterium]